MKLRLKPIHYFSLGLLLLASFLFGLNFDRIKVNLTSFFRKEKACRLEAKICPDGTTVGRTGPNCEFAPCPTESPGKGPGLGQCPKTKWIDCQPGPGRMKAECNPHYLEWARQYCPGFEGAAY